MRLLLGKRTKKLTDSEDSVSEEIQKVKIYALKDLERLGIIDDDILNFEINDFKKICLSITNNDINNKDIKNDISQIYAYELVIKYYDKNAVDTYYKGIKCKYEDRYFEGKNDFIKSVGFDTEESYEKTILNYIESINGEIGIGRVNMYSQHGKRIVGYIEDNSRQSLYTVLEKSKRCLELNNSNKTRGGFKVRKKRRYY